MTSSYKAKKTWKSKRYTSACSFIHSFWTGHTHDICYCTAMTSQFLPANFERQREVSLWVVPLSLSLSPIHCLNSVLHQLVDSVPVDHQGWMKLSSLHQLFKTLKVVNDTIRTLFVGVQIDYIRWTAGAEQHLEFPFNTEGLASLPLPRRTPVGRSHI